MLISSVIIGTLVVAIILISSQITVVNVLASTGFSADDFTGSTADNIPTINPNFDPDEDCHIDAYQDKCIPGTEQKCPDDFKQNEDGTCVPTGPCPEGYHSEDEDETGQCFQNEGGCEYPDYVLLESEDEGDRCAYLYYICDEAEHRNEDYCIEYCSENPDTLLCKPEVN